MLYSVTWSPDGSQLAASSSTGAIAIFDAAKGSLVKSLSLHRAASYRVEWHPTESNLLASASVDKSVVVFRADGTVTRSLAHPKVPPSLPLQPPVAQEGRPRVCGEGPSLMPVERA